MQVLPRDTERSRPNANRILPRECSGHRKHPLPTAQEKTLQMDLTWWSILKSDWFCSFHLKMEKLYTFSKIMNGSWLWLSDQERFFVCLFVSPNSLKLKKVGETTRPFIYDLNQIPYDYIAEWEIDLYSRIRNKFKRLDLTECLINYGQRSMTLYRRQGSRQSPQKRNAKNQNGCLRRPYKYL